MKKPGLLWEHFVAFDAEGNVLCGNQVTEAVKVMCRYCEWEIFPNQTRMRRHYQGHQEKDPSGNECVEVGSKPARSEPPQKKQALMPSFVDRQFTPSEQEAAEFAQVLENLGGESRTTTFLFSGISSCHGRDEPPSLGAILDPRFFACSKGRLRAIEPAQFVEKNHRDPSKCEGASECHNCESWLCSNRSGFLGRPPEIPSLGIYSTVPWFVLLVVS